MNLMIDVEYVAGVLARHQREAMGMTGTSPDVCRCGERVTPAQMVDDEIITDRRDRAFAAHQAVEIAKDIKSLSDGTEG